MENIDNILTIEVKKEIAERYFGFRRTIEKDSHNYLQEIKELAGELEETVGYDLVQIYTLLHHEDLIQEFISLAGLPGPLFVDSAINTPPKKQKIFTDQHFRGFTRKGCLHNMLFDTYTRLFNHVEEYRKKYQLLEEEYETICEQIKLFYRKNDIHTIFHFLRGLEGGPGSGETLQYDARSREDLEKKMQIDPPTAITKLLPDIPALPPEKSLRKELKALIVRTCRRQPKLDLRYLK